MPRVQLNRLFLLSLKHNAPHGTPEGRAVARIINELDDVDAALPGPNDIETVIPPSLRCYARPIPSAGLLVCYVLTPPLVRVVGVKRAG